MPQVAATPITRPTVDSHHAVHPLAALRCVRLVGVEHPAGSDPWLS